MNFQASDNQKRKTLRYLLEGIVDSPALDILGISSDSRNINPGDVFFACQGVNAHGLDFVKQVEAAGAIAIVWDKSTGIPVKSDLPMIGVDSLALRLGYIANRWYGAPSELLKVFGVTGTNGKTTVASLIAQAYGLFNIRCGYIGTLGSGIDNIRIDGSLTTPPCIEVHQRLAEFRDEGISHAAIEVSSHGLQQERVNGIKFNSAIFTNLTRDHLDYHDSIQSYFEVKSRLFLNYEAKNRIVCVDDQFGIKLAKLCGKDVVRVSTGSSKEILNSPYVFADSIVLTNSGSEISIKSSWGLSQISLGLIGDFNVSNALMVLSVLLCEGYDLEESCNVLGEISPPSGRMQFVGNHLIENIPRVYVDYSHTPASLEGAINALRSHCKGKIWCVFGCGGDRDKGKRPLMGKIADRLADHTIVTTDNPRNERPKSIIDEIILGMKGNEVTLEDRAEAIAYAINRANSEDIVLIAGKGHEKYQIVGDQRIFFSDSVLRPHCMH